MNAVRYTDEIAPAQAENKGFLGISSPEIPTAGIVAELARSERGDMRAIAAIMTIAAECREVHS